MTRARVLTYGDDRIPYTVNEVPTRTTRVAIHVNPDGSVVVDAPPNQPDETIAKAVQRRARWVSDNVAEAKGRFVNVRPREYVSGEQVLYLGRRYVLKVLKDDGSRGQVKLRGNRLEVRHAEPNSAKTKVLTRMWYRDRALAYFDRRVRTLANTMPWVSDIPPFRLLEMNRQWGSCSPDGELILNPHLVKAPQNCIDYVLIHELAHLRHHDHGPEFRKLLEKYSPGWIRTKRQLDDMVENLMAA